MSETSLGGFPTKWRLHISIGYIPICDRVLRIGVTKRDAQLVKVCSVGFVIGPTVTPAQRVYYVPCCGTRKGPRDHLNLVPTTLQATSVIAIARWPPLSEGFGVINLILSVSRFLCRLSPSAHPDQLGSSIMASAGRDVPVEFLVMSAKDRVRWSQHLECLIECQEGLEQVLLVPEESRSTNPAAWVMYGMKISWECTLRREPRGEDFKIETDHIAADGHDVAAIDE